MARVTESFKLEGLRELEQNLRQLPKATAKNVAKRTLIKSAEPFIAQARATAPRGPDQKGRTHLADSIQISTRLSKRQATLARREARINKSPKHFTEIHAGARALPHAHLVEYGTFKMAPRPFMRPAWDANKFRAMNIIATELGNEIMAAAKRMEARLRRKAAKV